MTVLANSGLPFTLPLIGAIALGLIASFAGDRGDHR